MIKIRDEELLLAQRQVFVLEAMEATGDKTAASLLKAWQEYAVSVATTQPEKNPLTGPLGQALLSDEKPSPPGESDRTAGE